MTSVSVGHKWREGVRHNELSEESRKQRDQSKRGFMSKEEMVRRVR